MPGTDENLDEFAHRLLGQAATVRRVGSRRLSDRGELDDFVQEVLLRAYERRSQLRDPELLPHWVSVIARNTASKFNRARKPSVGEPSDCLVDSLVDLGPTPSAALDRAESWSALRAAVESLADEDRDMVRARYFDDESYDSLADRHGMSRTAISTRLHRVRSLLRARLAAKLGVALAAFGVLPRRASAAACDAWGRSSTMKALLIAATLHLAAGVGWVAHVGVARLSDPDASVIVKTVRLVDVGGRGDTQAPSRGAPHVVSIGPGGYLAIAPELFDPVYEGGLTVEMWMYLEEPPGQKDHWVLFGKPDSYILTLRGAAAQDPWGGGRRTENGIDTTDRYVFLNRWRWSSGGGNVQSLRRERVSGRWLPVLVMLRSGAEWRERTHIPIDGAVELAKSDSPLHIGGMPPQPSEFGPVVGGYGASIKGWVGSVRVSRGLLYNQNGMPPRQGRYDTMPTEFTVEERTLALWNFHDGPDEYTDSVGGHVLRYVGRDPMPPPPGDLPPISIDG